MTWDSLLGLVLGLASLGYLMVVLARPEDFS
ncbi:potassium-transporting ATPase subunit F [Corynebacterium mastitidis]|uniref:Potassium-transporting ATPase subunit F n=1 Tax=Corynebacterium mastitidis TaxID=161890 RepID=A0ABU8NVP5_9CORY